MACHRPAVEQLPVIGSPGRGTEGDAVTVTEQGPLTATELKNLDAY